MIFASIQNLDEYVYVFNSTKISVIGIQKVSPFGLFTVISCEQIMPCYLKVNSSIRI